MCRPPHASVALPRSTQRGVASLALVAPSCPQWTAAMLIHCPQFGAILLMVWGAGILSVAWAADCSQFIISMARTCPSGYENPPNDPWGCVDIDECSTGSHNCDLNAHCVNTLGSFACNCSAGFGGNGTVCVGAIAGSGAHTCAVLSSGAAKCWGHGANGQLGNGGTSHQNTPVDVSTVSLL